MDTLRVSITDRCNLRCIYCMPPEGIPLLPAEEILTFEEIERVVRVAVSAGVTKVRLTGGEPLVRKNVLELVRRMAAIPGIKELPMTTNGVVLEKMAGPLKEAGLHRVSVSLDTLKPDRYERMTRRPWLHRVLDGVRAAKEAGLTPLKINAVVVPEENDGEVSDFVRLADREGLEVRFIEQMPLVNRALRPHCGMPSEEFVPSSVLKERIEAEYGELTPEAGIEPGRPARVYRLPGGGKIGFISPLSSPFCKWCQRMRLTPEGMLRPCLAGSTEIDIKGPLRKGASDEELKQIFLYAVSKKPDQDAACFNASGRGMSRIGG
ncbi:MAG: GTP 3',8-cyclase MoaA [bacterium]